MHLCDTGNGWIGRIVDELPMLDVSCRMLRSYGLGQTITMHRWHAGLNMCGHRFSRTRRCLFFSRCCAYWRMPGYGGGFRDGRNAGSRNTAYSIEARRPGAPAAVLG